MARNVAERRDTSNRLACGVLLISRKLLSLRAEGIDLERRERRLADSSYPQSEKLAFRSILSVLARCEGPTQEPQVVLSDRQRK